MRYTEEDKHLLSKVNDIGVQIGADPMPDINLIFIMISPYLDQLITLLKQLTSHELKILFMQYGGVKKVMAVLFEEEAKKIEKELKITITTPHMTKLLQ